MNINIYLFDNYTGMDIPERVDSVQVEVLLGGQLSSIHEKIMVNSQLFIIYTHLRDYDIVVQSENDKTILENILQFGNYNYNIGVQDNSIWYSDKVMRNIIISDSVDLDRSKLGTLLTMYLTEVKKSSNTTSNDNRIYIVVNNRTSVELFRSPDFNECLNLCDRHPCSIVTNEFNDVLYKSGWGKVSPPYSKDNHITEHKNKLAKLNKKGLSFSVR